MKKIGKIPGALIVWASAYVNVIVFALCGGYFFLKSDDESLKNETKKALIVTLIFVGIGMIGVAIIVDTLSALRRKRYDEYQIVLLEKVFLFNGLFTAVLFPLSLVVLILAPMYFVETIFALILFQWGVMAITELLYLITNYKV